MCNFIYKLYLVVSQLHRNVLPEWNPWFLALFPNSNIFWSVCSGPWHGRSLFSCSQHYFGELRFWSVFFITIQSEDREKKTPESMGLCPIKKPQSPCNYSYRYLRVSTGKYQLMCRFCVSVVMGKGSEELQEWIGLLVSHKVPAAGFRWKIGSNEYHVCSTQTSSWLSLLGRNLCLISCQSVFISNRFLWKPNVKPFSVIEDKRFLVSIAEWNKQEIHLSPPLSINHTAYHCFIVMLITAKISATLYFSSSAKVTVG